jgi:hypothetical protein
MRVFTFFALLCFAGIHALANSGGITGRTTSGCSCHSASSSNNTAISLTSGSTTVAPGSSNTYTLTMTNSSSRPRAGINIDFVNSSNTVQTGLATVSGQGMALNGSELTHSGAKSASGGTTTWTFSMTAPTTPGTYTMRVAGNATTSGSSGDWRLFTQTIIVKGLSITGPAVGSTICVGTQSVSWTSSGVSNVNIQLSSDGGSTFTTLGTATSVDGSNSSNVTIPGTYTPGTQYRFRVVDASDANVNSATASNITLGSQAVISTQPTPTTQSVCQGQNVSYSVSATGGGLQYQWNLNGSPINGATNATYSMTSVAPSNAGIYTVGVRGTCGTTITSTACTLSVSPAPAITLQPPSNLLLCPSGNATLSVTATGNNLTYQWRKSGTPINGATQSSYSINNATIADTGVYNVVINGDCAGSSGITSSSTIVAVSSRPSFSSNPKDTSACEGTQITLRATVAGSTSGLTLNWRKDGSSLSDNGRITGATTTQLIVRDISSFDEGSYQLAALVTQCSIQELSTSAVVTVGRKPKITSQPQSRAVPANSQVVLSVTAEGDGLTYIWKKGTTAIPNATSNVYSIGAVSSADEGTYTVEVRNACGTVTSNPANVSISTVPTPVASLSATSIQFGKLLKGLSAEKTVELSNSGNADLRVNTITFSGTTFSLVGAPTLPLTIKPNEKTVLRVSAIPTASGTIADTLKITTNATPATSLVAVSVSTIDKLFATNAVSFDSVEINKAITKSVDFTNGTDYTVNISDVTITGSVFVLNGAKPTTIAPQQTVQLSITATPQTVGNTVADLTLSYGTNLSETITLSVLGKQTTSVQEAKELGYSFYPNPIGEFAVLTMPELHGANTIDVVNTLGEVIQTHNVSNFSSLQLNTSSLPNGAYMVLINSTKGLLKIPFVKVR